MIKMIKSEQLENSAKRNYERSFELSLLQEELEILLTAIDRNNTAFEKGKISRNAFQSNENKLKKKSVKIINKIRVDT